MLFFAFLTLTACGQRMVAPGQTSSEVLAVSGLENMLGIFFTK